MFNEDTIAFIGCGNMGEAMVRGLLTQKTIAPERIIASDPRPERGVELEARYGIRTTRSNAEAAEAGQIVVLAIKPQVLARAVPDLRGRLRRRDLVLSIMAGIPIRQIADALAHAAVARAMPNTPGQIGQGISVWTATPEVSDVQRAQAQKILMSLGTEIPVDEESFLDMATALSGTGPAYVFLVMEAMIDAGVHMGFSRRMAKELVLKTMLGSVQYAAQSDAHEAELRNQVTSPAGTTAAALYQLEKGGLRTVISRGVWAAYERSIALGSGEKKDRL
jgi:pyrroline-5-carboxylate reductase